MQDPAYGPIPEGINDWPWFYNNFRPSCTGNPAACQVCNGEGCEQVIQKQIGHVPFFASDHHPDDFEE